MPEAGCRFPVPGCRMPDAGCRSRFPVPACPERSRLAAVASRLSRRGLRPRQQRAIRIGRIGGRHGRDAGFIGRFSRAPQQVHRARLSELRGAQAGRRSSHAERARFLRAGGTPDRRPRSRPAAARCWRPHESRCRAGPAAAAPCSSPTLLSIADDIGSRLHRPSADWGINRRDRKAARASAARPFRRREVGAKRVQRVVGDQSLPDQRPQRIDRFLREAATGRLVNRGEERRAVPAQPCRRSAPLVRAAPPIGREAPRACAACDR